MTTVAEQRHSDTRERILATAWDLCREDGLASLSLRALAARVGMRAPSLYTYFGAKHAIYDAMFRQGQEQLAEVMGDLYETRPVTRELLRTGLRRWFAFCTADPARYQLLYQRTIPGFEPSEESYAHAVAHLERLARVLADAGITDARTVDMWTAVTSGLVDQQIANEPGGDRWAHLLDEAVDMLCDHTGVLPENERH